MWFPVDYFTASPSAPRDRMEQTVGVILSGGRGDPFSWMRTSDGGKYNYAEGTVWLTRITPQTCGRMFKAAQVTNTFLRVGIDNSASIEIKGSKAKAWGMWGKAVRISTPAGLCAELRKDWSSLPVDAVETPAPANDYVALDDPAIRPPPTPAGEAAVTNDPSGVGARCEAETRKNLQGSPFAIVRSIVTQNPKWGVVWRADIKAPDDDPIWTDRFVCWQSAATGKLTWSKQPLAGWGPLLPKLVPLDLGDENAAH